MEKFVNVSFDHFKNAVEYLVQAKNCWRRILENLKTYLCHFNNYERALFKHPSNEINTIIQCEGEQ